MKLLPIIGALVAALTLSGCLDQRDGVAVLPPDKPRLDRPDSTSMADCAWPVIPNEIRSLTQEETEALLGSNADAQIECFYKHRTLANFIRTRDDGVSGRTPTGAIN